MGEPIFTPSKVPFVAGEQALRYVLAVAGQNIDVAVLSMGNPHCVLQVDDVQSAPVGTLGYAIEHHPRFPERANVGFMQIRDRQNIHLRVHERGVGETLACGTGACAAVVAGIAQGALDDTVQVQLPGGEVMVNWRRGDGPVWLTGNAEVISDGTIEL
jgi:diaminopimelate epimerase